MEFPSIPAWPLFVGLALIFAGVFGLGAACGKVGCPIRVKIERAPSSDTTGGPDHHE